MVVNGLSSTLENLPRYKMKQMAERIYTKWQLDQRDLCHNKLKHLMKFNECRNRETLSRALYKWRLNIEAKKVDDLTVK